MQKELFLLIFMSLNMFHHASLGTNGWLMQI